MENKINIVELLKDCPTGMELDCTMYNKVTLLNVDTDDTIFFPISVVRKDGNIIKLTKYGQYSNVDFAKCIIFPKGKNTWEGFQIPFKDGDIVATSSGIQIFILQRAKSNNEGYCYIGCDFGKNNYFLDAGVWGFDRLATEEEKEKLFKAIKDNGYRWDEETKNLVKLIKPKFKVGDKIKLKGGDEFGIITQVADCFYTIKCKNNTHYWSIKKQDDWELINEPKFKVGDTITPKDFKDRSRVINAILDNEYNLFGGGKILFSDQDNWELINGVNEPRFKAGDVIVNIYRNDSRNWKIYQITNDKYIFTDGSFIYIQDQNNWVLSTAKFDITTLKPFDKVLMRSSNAREWVATFYSHYSNNKFYGCGMCCDQCIPYEGNEHLLGTTDDCDEYFNLIS